MALIISHQAHLTLCDSAYQLALSGLCGGGGVCTVCVCDVCVGIFRGQSKSCKSLWIKVSAKCLNINVNKERQAQTPTVMLSCVWMGYHPDINQQQLSLCCFIVTVLHSVIRSVEIHCTVRVSSVSEPLFYSVVSKGRTNTHIHCT